MKLLIIILLGLGLLASPPTAQAKADLTLVCNQINQDCYWRESDPSKFFNEPNLAPGDAILKQLAIVNKTDKGCFAELKADSKNKLARLDLAKVINIYIYSDSRTWFGHKQLTGTARSKTLYDLYTAGFINLGVIQKGETQLYNWLAVIDKWKTDNSFQGTSTKFDISINARCMAENSRDKKLVAEEQQQQLTEELAANPPAWQTLPIISQVAQVINQVIEIFANLFLAVQRIFSGQTAAN